MLYNLQERKRLGNYIGKRIENVICRQVHVHPDTAHTHTCTQKRVHTL